MFIFHIPLFSNNQDDGFLTCFIDQTLSLLLHPFLIVVFDIFLVFTATAVGFPHRRLKEVQTTLINTRKE